MGGTVVKESGPRDWLSGGRFWDEIPTGPGAAPSLRPPVRPPSSAHASPRRTGSLIWGIVGVLVGAVCLYAMWAASSVPGLVHPGLGIVGGAVVVLLGIVAWTRRPQKGRGWSVLLPMLVLGAGAVSFFAGIAIANVQGIPPLQLSRAPLAAATPAAAASQPGEATAPSTAGNASVQAPAPAPGPVLQRPPATPMTLAQTLGTLQFVLKQSRGPDGLQPPALGVSSDGRVFDPFSATPERILVVLPAGSTLHYTVSVDRLNYAVTLASDTDPGVVARYDTVNGTVETG